MTAAGFIVGTPDYMSPEQARGENIDGRSDIFSLGGVLYFMLTGRKPFPALELPGLFNQIQNADPTPLADTEAPPELAAVILKALSKKVDARYQSCQALWEDLEVVRQRYPLAAPRTAASANLALGHIPIDTPAAQAESQVGPEASADDASPSTEDTVDLPVGEVNTDDTVTLEPVATWVQRVTGRIDSAVSGAFARVKRPADPNPSTPTGERKR
jgi:serine/threonine protein kinase